MLPFLKSIPARSSISINSFGGINTTSSYVRGELVSATNVNLDDYPALSSRKRRRVHSTCDGTINGVGCCDGYFYTFFKEESNEIFLWFGGNVYNYTEYSNCTDLKQKRKFAKTENSIIIIPDNVVFYTDELKFKSADINMYKSSVEVAKKVKDEFGENSEYNPLEDSPEIGALTHNSITARNTTHRPGSTVVYDFYCFEFDKNIEVGDVLTVKMDVYSPTAESSQQYTELVKMFKSGISAKVKSVTKATHLVVGGAYKTEITALAFEDNSFITEGFTDLVFKDISITKKLPLFTAITSFNNRVWGVEGKKLYASSLGDGDEWNDFSVDSYGTLPTSGFSASSGTDGDFTAIIPHGNFIYAMKEGYIHKVYGDVPDEFSVSNIEAPGAISGADTLCVCGAYLMYASLDGVCILRDGYPRVISKKLGKINPVCACAHGNNFYIICQNNNERILYIYNTDHNAWLAENCADNADNLYSDKNSVCFSAGNKLICIESVSELPFFEKHVSWNFRMKFGNGDFSQKTALRLMVRASLGENASFTAKIIYDDGSESAVCGMSYDETQGGSSLLFLPVKRELGFSVEFKGFGDFKMKNLKFDFYKGNEE